MLGGWAVSMAAVVGARARPTTTLELAPSYGAIWKYSTVRSSPIASGISSA